MSQPEAHLNATSLLHTFSNQPQRANDPLQASSRSSTLPPHLVRPHEVERCLQNVEKAKDRFVEAGAALGLLAQHDLVMPVRDDLLKLIQLERDMTCFKQALEQLPTAYTPTMQPTNWKALLEQLAADVAASSRFDPRKDQAVKEFDEAAHVELMGEDADEDQGGADEDADLEVVGGDTEKNARCPYTGKPVHELTQPVEDRAGFVYDKAAITQALQASGGVIVCPVAGASHQVRLADLKPCKRLERAKKAAKLQNLRTMMQQQATQGGGAGASSSRQKPGS